MFWKCSGKNPGNLPEISWIVSGHFPDISQLDHIEKMRMQKLKIEKAVYERAREKREAENMHRHDMLMMPVNRKTARKKKRKLSGKVPEHVPEKFRNISGYLQEIVPEQFRNISGYLQEIVQKCSGIKRGEPVLAQEGC